MEEIEKKAIELSAKYSCKVSPILFKDEETGEEIVGYIKEPNRVTKLRIMDKAAQGMFTASAELFDAILLKDESDKRFSSDKPEDDKYYIGGAMEAYSTVQIAVNQFKKK